MPVLLVWLGAVIAAGIAGTASGAVIRGCAITDAREIAPQPPLSPLSPRTWGIAEWAAAAGAGYLAYTYMRSRG